MFELAEVQELSEKQVKVIQNHLDMVGVLAAPAPVFSQRRSTDSDSVRLKC
jgi:hypothetical protein